MTNITPQVYKMSREGDKYIFVHQDKHLRIVKIEGTLKEIAYECFKKYVNRDNDGYALSAIDDYGPFWVDTWGDVLIITSVFADIEPQPEPIFWKELNEQFQRFMELVAFS